MPCEYFARVDTSYMVQLETALDLEIQRVELKRSEEFKLLQLQNMIRYPPADSSCRNEKLRASVKISPVSETWMSDSIVPADVKAKFVSQVAKLEDVPEDRKDWSEELANSLRSQVTRLEQDNMQLYLKIRYLHSYRAGKGHDSATRGGHHQVTPGSFDLEGSADAAGDVEVPYKSMYEEKLSLFQQFNKMES
ncbi:hypothetical protein ATCC90586_002764 [Pythium insidiosum]|nr:hypothetical protein ATCC90586_002764 [Pythium insidiosum]